MFVDDTIQQQIVEKFLLDTFTLVEIVRATSLASLNLNSSGLNQEHPTVCPSPTKVMLAIIAQATIDLINNLMTFIFWSLNRLGKQSFLFLFELQNQVKTKKKFYMNFVRHLSATNYFWTTLYLNKLVKTESFCKPQNVNSRVAPNSFEGRGLNTHVLHIWYPPLVTNPDKPKLSLIKTRFAFL